MVTFSEYISNLGISVTEKFSHPLIINEDNNGRANIEEMHRGINISPENIPYHYCPNWFNNEGGIKFVYRNKIDTPQYQQIRSGELDILKSISPGVYNFVGDPSEMEWLHFSNYSSDNVYVKDWMKSINDTVGNTQDDTVIGIGYLKLRVSDSDHRDLLKNENNYFRSPLTKNLARSLAENKIYFISFYIKNYFVEYSDRIMFKVQYLNHNFGTEFSLVDYDRLLFYFIPFPNMQDVIGEQGPPGPQGPQGPQGEPGVSPYIQKFYYSSTYTLNPEYYHFSISYPYQYITINGYDINGIALRNWFTFFSTPSNNVKGYLIFTSVNIENKFKIFKLLTSEENFGNNYWYKLTVEMVVENGGSFDDNELVSLSFSMSGDSGNGVDNFLDSNSIDFYFINSNLTADLKKQNSTTIDLVIDSNGLKSNLNSILKTNYDSAYTHISNTNNPHSVTKTQIGLENVDDIKQLPMNYLDIDPLLQNNSDEKVPSQKAIKTYINNTLNVGDGFGNIDCGTPSTIYLNYQKIDCGEI